MDANSFGGKHNSYFIIFFNVLVKYYQLLSEARMEKGGEIFYYYVDSTSISNGSFDKLYI